jgi:formamidopyrimidine-DNA glycosylase
MPELPEVERARKLCERVAAGRRIERARCAEDRIVFDGISPGTFARSLRGREVRKVLRRGKHLWFALDRPPHPLFHFGMAGGFCAKGETPLPLVSSGRKVEVDWPPRWAKVHLFFEGGGELVMTDKRRLGRVRLREEPEREPPIADLGFDPLLDPPGAAEFARLLRARWTSVKAVLLDQGFAAGVGNWIADEVLYQARIDPRRRADSLSEASTRELRAALLRVVRHAVKVDAEKDRFPRTWLFHRRWGKKAGATTARGERIVFLDVAGRTTAFVPSVQR